MSSRVEAWAWEKGAQLDLRTNERIVLQALAQHCDPHGYCWPSIETLMHMTGLSERTVQRVKKSLKEHDLMEVDERMRERGGRTSDGYRLKVPPAPSQRRGAPQKTEDSDSDPPRQRDGARPVSVTGAPRQCDGGGPVSVTGGINRSILNRSIEEERARAPAAWAAALATLESENSAADVAKWIRPLQVLELADEVVVLAPNPIVLDWVRDSGFLVRVAKLFAEAGLSKQVRARLGAVEGEAA